MTEKRIVLLAFLIMLAFAAFLSASTMSVLVAAHLWVKPIEIPAPQPFLPLPEEAPKQIAHFPAPKKPVCDGSSAPKVRLLATLVGDQDAHAVIELEGTVHVLAAGERVDDNELWEIARGGAKLKRSCDAQDLVFDDKPAPAARMASVSLNIDDVMSRMDQLVKDARFSPKMENGAMSIRVMSIRPGSLFDSSGLKNGDLIESVDGRPIFELGNMGAIHELKTKGTVHVRIKRGGEVIQIPVSLY